ncbi:VWA domain-containing protein [Natronorubrum halophilum]|uniref:VWA domain-containing protein n=1 Tax=Natronorubrum halophilum TaxID=1702106 RepID=UPI000EF65999|nr:VWA domain-containing protein [Natronorubrum halophilum]
MVAESGGKKLSSLPFPAIVGQDDLKRVLLTVAANDGLDGALIVGEKGTAKSTAVRGLVDLLPDQRAVSDCPYGCAPSDPALQCTDCRIRVREGEDLPVETRPVPLVTLPLGATRDRVVGTLSVEDALAGAADFDPGLLARANRGILYVDEVNLLDDHLVDVVLDAAASGTNTVERDGISVSHPANFTLVGTMNPEEGDLRPQLRDRFSLQATVEGCREIDERVEIIDRALETTADDEPGPGTEYASEVAALRTELAAARDRLSSVSLPADFKAEIAELCIAAGVDGHRGDVATARTAMTIAALEGRTAVIESDVHEAAIYALPHRLRSTPFEDEPDLEDLLEDRFDEGESAEAGDETDGADDEADGDEREKTGECDGGSETGTESGGEGGDTDRNGGSDGGSENGSDGTDGESDAERGPDGGDRPAGGERAPDETGDGGGSDPADGDSSERGSDESDDGTDEAQPLAPGRQRADIAGVGAAEAPDLETPSVESRDATAAGGSRASTAPSADNRGARVRTEPASSDGPIDAAASVRSAAARGESRVESRDLRRSVRAGETSVTIVFAVDASASMRPAMRTAKGVVLDLLRDSYQQRDRVSFVAFAGDDAEVLLPPTDSVSLAARHLKELPSGDRTPLPAGLETSRRVLERAETDAAVVVLVTDGRANVADGSPTDATRRAARGLAATDATVVVVDAGDDSRAGLSELIASETAGELVALSSLSAETVRAAADRAASDESPRSS